MNDTMKIRKYFITKVYLSSARTDKYIKFTDCVLDSDETMLYLRHASNVVRAKFAQLRAPNNDFPLFISWNTISNWHHCSATTKVNYFDSVLNVCNES